MTREEKVTNKDITAFFEALMKSDPDVGEVLFTPVAYSSFRNLEAIVQDKVYREFSDERWFQELKPHAQVLIRLSVGASITVLQQAYKQYLEAKRMRELGERNNMNTDIQKSTGKTLCLDDYFLKCDGTRTHPLKVSQVLAMPEIAQELEEMRRKTDME